MSDDLDIFIKAIGSQLKSYPDICKAQKTVDADKETMQVNQTQPPSVCGVKGGRVIQSAKI